MNKKLKKELITGLETQIVLMVKNSELLKKVCPDLGHDVELVGAAKITQTWIDGISKDYE